MPTVAKVRRIIVLLKYSQYYARLLKSQNQANNIQGRQKVGLDSATRWNSTCEFTILINYILLITLNAYSFGF
jgi:hypothetical protein